LTKLLALVALVVLLWLALRRARAAFLASPRGQELRSIWQLLRQIGAVTQGGAEPSTGATGRGGGDHHRPTATSSPTLLVRCTVCGTHVPEERARRRATRVYCSAACEQRAEP
jgi:hypothetical protein